jgi:transcriptional regulator with XRE-family HTH domain
MIRLTVERKHRGWTQGEVQRRSGVNASTLSLIESGRYRPGPGQLDKLRRAFGVRPEDAERLLEAVPVDPLGVVR